MKNRARVLLSTTALLAVSSLLLAGCVAETADEGPAAGPVGPTADLAAATEYIQPYLGAPTEMAVTEPLAALPAPGSSIIFLDQGTPITSMMWELLQPIADVVDIKLERVQTGFDAQTINSALNSVVEKKPDAVMASGLNPVMFADQLQQLRDAGVAFVPASIVNGDEFDFDNVLGGYEDAFENGKVLASGIIWRTKGEASEFVFYNVPELPFSPVNLAGAEEQMAELCPECTMRVVDISISELGSTAAQSVVSDLQAHPETQAFITSLDEVQMGLAAAMEVAGINVPGLGQSPSPANLQAVADGKQDSTFAVDFRMFMWLLMDQTLRTMAGQESDRGTSRETGTALATILTAEDTFNPEYGYVAFPDMEERFTKLWTGK